MATIKNWNTEIDEGRTVGEIVGILASKGARSVNIDYDEQGRPKGIGFIVTVYDVPIPFKLPCDFDGVFEFMAKQYRDPRAKRQFESNANSKAQSRRTAWRIIKNWVEAQMAIIDAGQATMAQVFLPYVRMAETNNTMYEDFLQLVSKQKALKAENEPSTAKSGSGMHPGQGTR